MTNDLKVEWVAIGRLFCNPANPRINDPAVEPVKASIRRFGWQQPIVAKPSGEVIAGNTRLKAAKSLGMGEVPVTWFSGTDLDATAFGIADNRTHDFSSFDAAALAALLEQLRAEDSLDGVGFSTEDIDALLDEVMRSTLAEESADLDQVPEPPDAAVTRSGDLWQLGSHRLLCADSARPQDVDRLLGGERIHLINTDPPYNVQVAPRSNNAVAAAAASGAYLGQQGMDAAIRGETRATNRKLRPKDRPLANDFVSDEEFARLLHAWFGNIQRVLEPGRSFYIWGGYSNIWNYPKALRDSELYFSQMVIWVKEHPVLTRKDFMGNHEWCFYGWREGAAHEFFGPNNVTDVWSVHKVNPQSMVHLTEKPVELASRAILYSSRRGENVLDLFGGSGSTLIACEQTERHGFLMELDSLYADVIVTRWQNLTHKKATLDGTTKTFDDMRAERLGGPVA